MRVPSKGERLLRRVVPRASLAQPADRILRRLIDAGLLTIELAHERLINDWPKLPLKRWLAQDASDRRLIDQLRQCTNDDTLPDGLLAQAKELLQRDHELAAEERPLAQLVQRARDQKHAREWSSSAQDDPSGRCVQGWVDEGKPARRADLRLDTKKGALVGKPRDAL
jgi:hypothetical protein